MHIEPGLVEGGKQALAIVTAAGGVALAARMAAADVRRAGLSALGARAFTASALVLVFFEVLPHAPVGVSEVHLILGATLFLLLGGGAAAIGLGAGLLVQGAVFAPADLPQYAMNLTTLLVPLWAVSELAARRIPPGTRYADLSAARVAGLSLAYQGGIVAWVAFWAFWGQGAVIAGSVAQFGAAYLAVVLIEPLVALTCLWAARRLGHAPAGMLAPRVLSA